ncbi:hypothetical protein JJB09_20860 [Rhizobium sp. KVB221]|uniref:Calcium-binding protein n=1 Tax=Rhizobium setariae TaxID=2801340 RepID=A0A937CQV7_9HYPH|nr:hypothetical protein [Rhizobium setariae]MBL0374468.1 hypothetical protein [Rhizobium setariae]
MARIKYNAPIETFQTIWDGISETELTVTRDRGDKVVVEDAAGNQLEFSGKNLDWTDAGLVGGVIREISLSNERGKELFEIKDVKLDAASFTAAFNENGLDGVLSAALVGDDDIKGSKGADWLDGMGGEDRLVGDKGDDFLDGGVGNDLLIGGHGSDSFVFKVGGGTDFVKDFNLGNKGSDFIAVDADLIEFAHWQQDGKNLVIDFGGEDKLILKHVDAEDFSSNFIVALPEIV